MVETTRFGHEKAELGFSRASVERGRSCERVLPRRRRAVSLGQGSFHSSCIAAASVFCNKLEVRFGEELCDWRNLPFPECSLPDEASTCRTRVICGHLAGEAVVRAVVNDVSPNARRRALRGAHQLERKLLANMYDDPDVRLAVRPIRKSLAAGAS